MEILPENYEITADWVLIWKAVIDKDRKSLTKIMVKMIQADDR
jgi:hypothetical protein